MRVYLLMVVVMLTSLCYNRFIAKGCFVVLYISVFTLGFVLFSLYFEGFCVQDWIVVVRFVVWIVQCSRLDCWCSLCSLNCSVFMVGLLVFSMYFELFSVHGWIVVVRFVFWRFSVHYLISSLYFESFAVHGWHVN
jgi:hypothetical protein